MPDLDIFGQKVENNIVIFKHPRIFLNAKFSEKMKMPKFGTKMLYLGILGLEFETNIVTFEIITFEFV